MSQSFWFNILKNGLGHLKEKALPSAGALRFYQSMLCNSFNWCYETSQTADEYYNEKLEVERLDNY